MKSSSKPCRPGRPRAFEEGAALEKAMHVFWRKGYDATSIADLTEAMGINPPSLYAAFGNKEALYLRVLQHYGEGRGADALAALSAPTAREVAERRLLATVEWVSRNAQPSGCLVVQAAMRSGDVSGPIGEKLKSFCAGGRCALIQRLERAKAEGDLPPTADPAALARYLDTVTQGLALQASTGATRAELLQVVQVALAQWPSSTPKPRTKVPRGQ